MRDFQSFGYDSVFLSSGGFAQLWTTEHLLQHITSSPSGVREFTGVAFYSHSVRLGLECSCMKNCDTLSELHLPPINIHFLTIAISSVLFLLIDFLNFFIWFVAFFIPS